MNKAKKRELAEALVEAALLIWGKERGDWEQWTTGRLTWDQWWENTLEQKLHDKLQALAQELTSD